MEPAYRTRCPRPELRLFNVHPAHQLAIELIDVPDRAVVEDVALQIAHDLVYVDCRQAAWAFAEAHRFDMRIDHAPLAKPIGPHRFVPDFARAFHAVRPIHVRSHGAEDGVDITCVESGVQRAQAGFAVVHATKPKARAWWCSWRPIILSRLTGRR